MKRIGSPRKQVKVHLNEHEHETLIVLAARERRSIGAQLAAMAFAYAANTNPVRNKDFVGQ